MATHMIYGCVKTDGTIEFVDDGERLRRCGPSPLVRSSITRRMRITSKVEVDA